MKRIVFPLEGMNRSGGMRIISQLANSLAETGYRVVFLVPDYASEPQFQLSDSIQVVIVSTGSIRILKKIIYRMKLCMVSVADADISIATGYKTTYYIFFSKFIRLSKVKLLYLIQHFEPFSHALAMSQYSMPTKYILYLIAKLTYRLPFRRVTVSTWIKEKIGCVTVDVVPNGVDLDVFKCSEGLNARSGKFTVGVIGSSSPWKEFQVFEKAITQIMGDGGSQFNVLVATADRTLHTSIKQADIIHPANDDELLSFYHQCDLFVFPSLIEGFGLPPLEAMACGIPVIVSKCGGVAEYCNSENSVLVDPGNAGQIADSILLLKNNVDRRQKLRKKGLETATKFSADKMLRAYACLIEEC